MATIIERRVARLEEASGAGGECPDCGCGGSDDDFGPNDTYEVQLVDPGGAEDREEFCGSCGRQLVIVLTWGDDAP